MIIPAEPVLGEATMMDDEVVGILSNGVLLDSHEQTWAYDICNGHSDKKHQYHYHIPPICLMESMGVSFADSASWWINDEGNATRDFADLANQFPDSGPASPVIGFARDGFPIFGPYDDAGSLQRGAAFGGDLDECNGKMDGYGSYGYYMTVDPPFAPPCLKGEIGLFTYSTSDIACPKEGIMNTILAVEADDDLSMAVGKTNTDSKTVEEGKKVDEESKVDEEGSNGLGEGISDMMEDTEFGLSSGVVSFDLARNILAVAAFLAYFF